MSGAQLVHYNNFRRELAAASRMDEVKKIYNKAEALRHYYHMIEDAEAEAQLAEIKIRARARIGELSMELEQPTRGPKKVNSASGNNPGKVAALRDAGISTSIANRCEQVHRIFKSDGDKVEAFIAQKRARKEPITEKEILRTVGKRIMREERVDKLMRRAEAFPDKRYQIILADPAWRYDAPLSDNRRIENHYPTMSLEAICALPVSDLAAPDAAVFLWAAMLKEGFAVLKAWGFDYRAHVVWVKPSIGMGQWVRVQDEILLIGIRGNMPVPLEANRSSSVIHAARGRHSEKPVEAYEIIERGFPEFEKIELFARRARPGWARWGLEAPQQQEAAE